MKNSEPARSIHQVDADEKGVGQEKTVVGHGYRFAITEEQEQFLRNVSDPEQDKIFRKACA